MTHNPITAPSCIVRNTAGQKGRNLSVVPGSTSSRYLHYGRIILDAGNARLRFNTNQLETGLICLKGSATVVAGGQSSLDRARDDPEAFEGSFTLGRFDSLYVPRDTSVEVTPGSEGCDLAEIAAPVGQKYPIQFVAFRDVQQNPGLHFNTGGPANQRELNILIGKNVEAGRILAGVTFSSPGNWTSWPPHEHAAMLEEAYLYIDMPAPAFGVQLVYTNKNEPELATIVREGDVVLMPQGYHPNVAAPGGSINFLWMMAANREKEDRQFGVVNVQPDFAAGGSGLEASRK